MAENLVANELMIESGGQLSPFQPVADDDGIDVLIYNKANGAAIPLQIKARTKTIRGGNTVHFEVRKKTLRDDRGGMFLGVLLDESLRVTKRAWLVPLPEFPSIAYDRGTKFMIRPSLSTSTQDKYRDFQCKDMREVAQRLIAYDPGLA